MNPLEWLKLAYETFGAKHPTGSLIGVMVVGSLAFGALWLLGAQQYEKSRAESQHRSPAPLSINTTNGPQSPIIPNNSGTVKITNEETKPDTLPPKE